MIHELYLRNFRAFKEQHFDFSRINIFVGPNNSGKSSAISAINLLAQTVSANESGAPLLLKGKYDDLGTYIDLVHGNAARTPMTIEFGFGRGGVARQSIRVEYKYRLKRRHIDVTKFDLSISGEPLFAFQTRKDAYDIRYKGRKVEQFFDSFAKRRPEFPGLTIEDPNLRRMRFAHVRRDEADLFVDEESMKALSQTASWVFRSNSQLRQLFRGFDSLSPFREPPQRTFLFSGEAPKEVGPTGSKAIDILVSDRFAGGRAKRGLIDAVSKFFAVTGMAKGIDVKALTSRHFEICLISQDGKSHNICDVGFGCSQVLPVLVGGLNTFAAADRASPYRGSPIFVVQEPEIHLHPNAQAQLGSFFVDLAEFGGQLFIETHSDNLVLRLQRHVARGDLAPEDVKVFYVKNKDGQGVVSELAMDEGGVFKNEWPGGFFPQRQVESYQLARDAAEAAKKK